MILRFLHWVASNGWVYDRIQTAVGANTVYSEVTARIPRDLPNPVLLDIGGGTGTLRRHLNFRCRYICLDLEAPKLQMFRQKFPGGLGVQADATRLPLPDESVDTAVCTLVSHHLPEDVFEAMLRECRRVLRPDGCFVFVDALLSPTRTPSRILWALDRGAHPHRLESLSKLVERQFEVASSARLTIWHEYLALVLRKNVLQKNVLLRNN